MTEKRFTLSQNGTFHTVRDNAENKPLGVFEFRDDEFPVYACFHRIIDLMNNLSEENEQLKQFKEDVFNKIDMHLRMLPIARDNEFNGEYGDPSLYSGAIYMLETLKKELQE